MWYIYIYIEREREREREREMIMMKDLPESYKPYLMFLVCARLYDFNLMGTREFFGFFLFLIFMFGMLLLGYLVIYFNRTDVQRVLGAEIEPMF